MYVLLTHDAKQPTLGLLVLRDNLLRIGLNVLTVVQGDEAAEGALRDPLMRSVDDHALNPVLFSQGRSAEGVRHAIQLEWADDIALVASGINDGLRVGPEAVHDDGFLAAAEGAALGLPALSISQEDALETGNVHWAADIATELIVAMVTTPPPPRTVLHVNVPSRLQSRGLALTTINAQRSLDIEAVRAGKVSVTPLCLEAEEMKATDETLAWTHTVLQSLAHRLTGHETTCTCC